MAEPFHLPDGTFGQWSRPRWLEVCPVVLIHGVGMSSRFWQPQLDVFGGERFCVAYDMLGHGGSPLPPPEPTLDDYSGQLACLMDAMSIERAVVVGHSMGALVTLHYALAHPERVAAVVPMNAVFRRTPEQKAAVAQRLADLREGVPGLDRSVTLRRWFGDEPQPASRAAWDALDRALQDIDPVGYERSYGLFAASDEVHADRLPTLAMPACFLTGALDPNSTPAMSEAMAALAPHGRAVVLPGERHMMSFISPGTTDAVLAGILSDADQRLTRKAAAPEIA